jgi:hypothetical protein
VIKKTIIAALGLFITYNLFLAIVKPEPGQGQHQWQKNIILMQDYADFHQDVPVVIVGTSLSARIYNYLLPKDYYNISLAGGSIFEGLSMVKQNPHKPKYVLIESNIFYREPNKEAIEGIFDPYRLKLRKWLPSTREAYQPANLLTPLIGNVGKNKKTEQKPGDTAIVGMLLKQRIKEYQEIPKQEQMDRNLALLKKYVHDLQSAGVKVIFYEIPINCALLNTPRYLIPKSIILKAFPPTEFSWMPEPDCKLYQYSDGEHMAYESSEDFVKWFVKQGKNLGI